MSGNDNASIKSEISKNESRLRETNCRLIREQIKHLKTTSLHRIPIVW